MNEVLPSSDPETITEGQPAAEFVSTFIGETKFGPDALIRSFVT